MFVSFEGVDGSGKSTQAQLLHGRLRADGIDALLTREPGGTAVGERIRELLLHAGDVSPWTETALFAAARAQLVEEVIRPALARGATVVCDRYVDSSLAYQGVARGLGLEEVLALNLSVVGGLLPDLTILLSLDAARAEARLAGSRDRIEREGAEFLTRVGAAYVELARSFPERIVTVDASREADDIADLVYERVRRHSRAA
jgi:dTMP kinase